LCSLTFFGSTSTVSRFGERFCDGQYNFLFAVLLTVPESNHLSKSKGHVLPPPRPYEVGAGDDVSPTQIVGDASFRD